jgi:predicted ester cyclase
LHRRLFVTMAALAAASLATVPKAAFASDSDAARAAILDLYVAAFNAHDVDAFAGFIADHYLQHNGRAGQGLAGLQTTLRGYFQTFPDFHMQIEDRVFGGDRVVARSTLTATHTQPVQFGPGTPVFPPTGKHLAWGAIDIWRVADGKFAEHWDENDFVGLARQLRGD